jgi:hypothetical protein
MESDDLRAYADGFGSASLPDEFIARTGHSEPHVRERQG